MQVKENEKTICWLNVCPFWHHRMVNYSTIWTKRILISLTQKTLISVEVDKEHENMALEQRINYCAPSKLVAGE